jgi:glycosyltransferase involved in cell wall biosynthesis
MAVGKLFARLCELSSRVLGASAGVNLIVAIRASRARDWECAIRDYDLYLAKRPGHASIWVQYGHALKESGRLGEAERAYNRAVALRPNDLDAYIHLAHLIKRLGRVLEAAGIFHHILKLRPGDVEALWELEQSGHRHQAQIATDGRPDGLGANCIFLEIKDLFQFLFRHATVTGITRVTLGLIHHVLYEMPDADSSRYQFVHQHGDGEGALLISHAEMRRILAAATQDKPKLMEMQRLIAEIREGATLFRLATGDTYLILGAFWDFLGNPSWLSGMRQRGVLIGAYLYDLIPITHPQYCAPGSTENFAITFAEMVRLLDFALTISAFVADEVRAYLRIHDVRSFPVMPVRLAHVLHFVGHEPTRKSTPQAIGIQHLAGRDFVLCVCTIEARKNHLYLFSIWERMLDAGIDVPHLVFVGREGWQIDMLKGQLDRTNYLGGRVHILSGVGDMELADLYDRCLFTAFPSFVEGWGLPVGESLAHGKVCVASSTTSIPEVGGEFAIYVDPFDTDEGYSVITGLLANPASLRKFEDNLRTSFKPRTWTDVGRDFFEAITISLEHVDPISMEHRLFAPRLPAGCLLDTTGFARGAVQLVEYANNPFRLIFCRGWRRVEAAGSWMLDAKAILLIQTNCAPLSEVSVVLHIETSSWVGPGNILSVSTEIDGEPQSHVNHQLSAAETDTRLIVESRTDSRGNLKIALELNGFNSASSGNVPVAVRMRTVGYTPRRDSISRTMLLENGPLS